MHSTVTARVENQARLKISMLVALAGFATALAMSGSNSSLRFHLPDSGFHLSATIGAGLAGFFFASGFGNRGAYGALIAAASAVAVTFAGAALGAALINPIGVGMPGGILGVIAILDAADEPGVFKIWIFIMVLLHICAEKIRSLPARES